MRWICAGQSAEEPVKGLLTTNFKRLLTKKINPGFTGNVRSSFEYGLRIG